MIESEHAEEDNEVFLSRVERLLDSYNSWIGAQAAEAAAASSLEAAVARLADLIAPPAVDELFRAEQSLSAAQSNLESAESRLADLTAPPDADALLEARQSLDAALASHNAAVARLDDLQADADPADIYQAEQAIAAARANRDAALARQVELLAAASNDDIRQAEASLESARLTLDEARASYDALLGGSTDTAIEQQRQNVRLAEISVEDARAELDETLVVAHFDGVIEDIAVQVGDQVLNGAPAMVLSTRDEVLIDLTVTEAEIFTLDVGQVGIATFDAIEDFRYGVRIASVGRVPQVDQGVVTYTVEAALLGPDDIPSARSQLEALGGGDIVGRRGRRWRRRRTGAANCGGAAGV